MTTLARIIAHVLFRPIDVAWTETGPVLVTIGGSPSVGSCKVRVTYATPSP